MVAVTTEDIMEATTVVIMAIITIRTPTITHIITVTTIRITVGAAVAGVVTWRLGRGLGWLGRRLGIASGVGARRIRLRRLGHAVWRLVELRGQSAHLGAVDGNYLANNDTTDGVSGNNTPANNTLADSGTPIENPYAEAQPNGAAAPADRPVGCERRGYGERRGRRQHRRLSRRDLSRASQQGGTGLPERPARAGRRQPARIADTGNRQRRRSPRKVRRPRRVERQRSRAAARNERRGRPPGRALR